MGAMSGCAVVGGTARAESGVGGWRCNPVRDRSGAAERPPGTTPGCRSLQMHPARRALPDPPRNLSA
ncbi:hypothetical protein ML5_5140 [Micromonospora sp. L5]|nr:hypothetical protein ML5_5140 [Micromonospora sp. L5]